MHKIAGLLPKRNINNNLNFKAMKKPKVYYMRLKKMLVQLKQMKIELQQMHDEMEERYNNMSENRKDSDFGYDMGDIIDHLYYAFGSDMDSLIDYIDEAANGIMTLPLAEGYPSQRGLEEYEEMKLMDEAESGAIAKFNSECAPTTGTNDDDSGNSRDYDGAIAALNSLAGMTGAYMGWKLGSSTGFNNRDEQKETPKGYQGYSTDDPEWRDEDNDGFDDRDEANDGMDDRDDSEWEDDEDYDNEDEFDDEDLEDDYGSDGLDDDFDGFDDDGGYEQGSGFEDDFDGYDDERGW